MKKRRVIILVILLLIILAVIWYLNPLNFNNKFLGNCASAGQTSANDATGKVKICCNGLKSLGGIPDQYSPDRCEEAYQMYGFGAICTNCGNGNCEKWENKCNCPEDC
jgi:hypothetical protein